MLREATSATTIPAPAEAVEELASELRGDLITPADAAYDEARTLYNAMIDRRPGLISRCQNVADVIAAVNFAREHDADLAAHRLDDPLADGEAEAGAPETSLV